MALRKDFLTPTRIYPLTWEMFEMSARMSQMSRTMSQLSEMSVDMSEMSSFSGVSVRPGVNANKRKGQQNNETQGGYLGGVVYVHENP